MKNADIANLLKDVSFFIEMGNDLGDSIFKSRAYQRAAEAIIALPDSIEDIYNAGGVQGLTEIPSIGKAIALKIEECIKTGKIEYLEKLRSKTPINISEFYGLKGIGPKTLKVLYDRLKIKNLDDLEQAASEGKLRSIAGFTPRKEHAILANIKFFRKGKDRRLLGEILPLVKQIESKLASVGGVKHAIAAGSFRRMQETIGDIDYLVCSSEPELVMDYFVKVPEVQEIFSRGQNKASVRLNNGMNADLLVVPEENFGSALQYFTGSKEHSIRLRKIAISKAMRLNEWGVFDKENKQLAGPTEEGVYKILGLQWMPPEMRENNGEIQMAKNGELPQLIDYDQLKGDLQVHSNNTDGTMSIENMALAAKNKFGLDYIAITDHTKSLTIARGLDEQQLLEQANKIEILNDRLSNSDVDFRVLSGAEVNILKDGSLDIADNVLEKLDVVGAAIHSHFALPEEVQTDRLVKAARNPCVDIIFHPTGRLINKRDGYPVDIDKLIDIARDTGTILEIDAHYDRLDLRDENIRRTINKGVKLTIDSDAHHPVHYAYLNLGVAQARRGWAKKSDILNTLSVNALLKSLK